MRQLELPRELSRRISALPEGVMAPETLGRITEVGAALEAAQSEVKLALAEAQATREAARAEGLAEGRLEGRREAMAKLDDHHGRLDELRAEMEAKVGVLAREVVEAVLGAVPEGRRIALAARQAVRHAGIKGRVRLVTRPALAKALGEAIGDRLGDGVELEVVTDAAVPPKSAWMETALGRIDLSGPGLDRAIHEALTPPEEGTSAAVAEVRQRNEVLGLGSGSGDGMPPDAADPARTSSGAVGASTAPAQPERPMTEAPQQGRSSPRAAAQRGAEKVVLPTETLGGRPRPDGGSEASGSPLRRTRPRTDANAKDAASRFAHDMTYRTEPNRLSKDAKGPDAPAPRPAATGVRAAQGGASTSSRTASPGGRGATEAACKAQLPGPAPVRSRGTPQPDISLPPPVADSGEGKPR